MFSPTFSYEQLQCCVQGLRMRLTDSDLVLVGMHPPGPPLARPVLPRERGALDRVIEYLVGDGPQNR